MSALLLPTPLVLISMAAGCALAFIALALFRLFVRLRRRLALTLQQKFALEASLEIREAEEARTRAEAASEAKSRLLATMSHEIRTPLNGILGMAELLVATGLDPEQQSYVEAMRASGLALTALIEEILDFSKIEAGKFELAQAPFDLIGLVEGVVELLAPQAQNKGLEIASSIEAGLQTRVVGDAARLRQLLINLVGNAVKYTVQGGVGLRVTAFDDWTEFAILDTGPGITPEHRDSIFDEFAIAEQDAQSQTGSTGLGLSISRRLAEQMGGGIELKASAPSGSVFVLRVPLPPARNAEPLAAPKGLAGRRALIVAASRFEAPYLAEKLTAAGIELLWAASEEASQIFLRDAGRVGRPPDLMIVDCALGSSAARTLGEAARNAGVGRSFIFFSPSERRAFGQNALQLFDDWLIKPLRARSLYTRLAEPASPAPTPSAPREKPLLLEGLRVLLAEDNEINALIVERHVSRRGANVTHVRDGLAASEVAQAALTGPGQKFDAILLDIRMPGLDGIEVARRVRAAERTANALPVRIIALSADAVEAAVDAARNAGVDVFLTKPVDLDRLDQVLAAGHSSLLREEKSAGEPARRASGRDA
ncbi:MAG TPA: ATP-binding protein [Methylovirgula sp.]